PGDVGALLAGEKEHGIGNIFWPANSAYWDLLLILCQDLRSDHAEHRSADYPWRERIHGDLSAGQLLRRHAGKADHSGLRRSVIGLSVEPDHSRDRGDVDDPAAVAQDLRPLFAAVKDSVEVRFDHAAPLIE